MSAYIRPQEGKQDMFLRTSADIAIYGGARGGGKSYALLLEPLRHSGNEGFRAAFFRRTTADLLNAGGLWDTSKQIYKHVHGARPRATPNLDWQFKSGAQFQFHHLQHESDAENHRGAQYAYIAFDELPQFSASQFWFLLSANRSTCGVRPYVRATCNPGPGWVKDLIAWWLDDEGRFAREDRAGVIRYFVRGEDGELIWGMTPGEVREQAPERFKDNEGKPLDDRAVVKTLTFIPAKLDDNVALTSADPSYRATLANMPLVERKRFLEGDWAITDTAGTVFREEWFPFFEGDSSPTWRRVRYWDLAGSKRRRSDFTAGVKTARTGQKIEPIAGADAIISPQSGIVVIEDAVNVKMTPGAVEELIQRTAQIDGRSVEIHIEEEKGAAAKFLIHHMAKNVLPGFVVRGSSVAEGDKLTRAKPMSSAAEHGFVRLRQGAWNKGLLSQLQSFPDGVKDDMVDAAVGSFNRLQEGEFAWVTVKR